MKRLLILLYLFSNFYIHAVLPQPGDSLWHVAAEVGTEVDIIDSKVDLLLLADGGGSPCNPTVITASTIITTSGHYCLSAHATITTGTGIIINASDVFLDLNGHILIGSGGSNGIVINNPRVTVFNGAIHSMSEHGLLLASNDCHIYGCDFLLNVTGMQILNGSRNLIEHCNAVACTDAGFDLMQSTSNSLINCNALGIGNIPVFGNVVGFISTNGAANSFYFCSARNIENDSGTGGCTGFRFLLQETQSSIVECNCSNIISVAPTVIPYGIQLIGNGVMVPTNCLISHNRVDNVHDFAATVPTSIHIDGDGTQNFFYANVAFSSAPGGFLFGPGIPLAQIFPGSFFTTQNNSLLNIPV